MHLIASEVNIEKIQRHEIIKNDFPKNIKSPFGLKRQNDAHQSILFTYPSMLPYHHPHRQTDNITELDERTHKHMHAVARSFVRLISSSPFD